MYAYIYIYMYIYIYVYIYMYDIRGPHKKMERIFQDVADSNFSLVSLSAGHHNEDALAKGTRLVSIRSLADGHVVTSLDSW